MIRPAPATRAWMDETPEAFAYRCLPLNIANAHGWEVLSPCGFEAAWTGGPDVEAVKLRLDPGCPEGRGPVSLFGQGVLTFHIEGVFRTPPGWGLWIGGSPNRFKDGLSPLTGVVETDWSPFTFTMNWRFTRPDHWVRFEAQEPICFLFPLQRSALERFRPRFAPITTDPALLERFTAWTAARDSFQARMARDPPQTPSAKWQKHYYRGVDVAGTALTEDHCTKLRLRRFENGDSRDPPLPSASPQLPELTASPAEAVQPRPSEAERDLRKRNWLLDAMERQRLLSPAASAIERRAGLSREEFLARYYAPGRPVILTGEMTSWPATRLWSTEYLTKVLGNTTVEFQGGRSENARFEMFKDVHRREAPFDAFMQLITEPNSGNESYLTAFNSEKNTKALSPLQGDLGYLDKYLTRKTERLQGMIWIGPAGTTTSLHHDLANNLIAQIVGRKRLKILPASTVARAYNHVHVFSEVADLEDPGLDLDRFPLLRGAPVYDVTLLPGEIIYMPLGWWHQVKALDFSVTATYTNFIWSNDAAATYPDD